MGRRAAGTGALGWRSHSGWAVLVAVGGWPDAVVVVHRQRVELLDGSLPRQPYHAADDDGLSLDEAASLISEVEFAATSAAAVATEAAVAILLDSGRSVDRVGVVASDRQIPCELGRIMASHLLLHAAEGRLYERALIEGCARAGTSVTTSAPATVFEDAARATSMTVAELTAALAESGRLAGPPWQKDHREAAAAALVALGA